MYCISELNGKEITDNTIKGMFEEAQILRPLRRIPYFVGWCGGKNSVTRFTMRDGYFATVTGKVRQFYVEGDTRMSRFKCKQYCIVNYAVTDVVITTSVEKVFLATGSWWVYQEPVKEGASLFLELCDYKQLVELKKIKVLDCISDDGYVYSFFVPEDDKTSYNEGNIVEVEHLGGYKNEFLPVVRVRTASDRPACKVVGLANR